MAGNQAVPDRGFDLLALRDGGIVGWCFVWSLPTAEPMFGLAVGDEHRGQGLGGRLMDQAMAEARRRGLPRVCLTVVTDKDVAWGLYERRGFAKYDECLDEGDGLAYYRMAWASRAQS